MLAVKLLILAAVGWGVAHTVTTGWEQLGHQDWQIDWRWIVAASGLYLLGLLPPAWFWWRILWALGVRPTWNQAFTAHMYGHLGKYVPGKGLVVVLRAASLPRKTVPLAVAVIGVFLETLTLMAVGALLAAILSLWIIGWDWRTVGAGLVTLLVVGIPTLPPVASRIVLWLAARRITSIEAHTESKLGAAKKGLPDEINFGLMGRGWLASGASWIMLGASLGAVLQSLHGGAVPQATPLPLLVAAVSLATVVGFISLIPGGLGVRDGLLVVVLAPEFGEATALAASVLLRMVWIISELGVCGILHAMQRREAESSSDVAAKKRD